MTQMTPRLPRLTHTSVYFFFLLALAQSFAAGCGGSDDQVPSKSTSKGGKRGTTDTAGSSSSAVDGNGGAAGTNTSESGGMTSSASAGSAGMQISATAGAWAGPTADCGLPAVGTTGVPQPADTPADFTILNWAGYKGAVTYTFDDGNSSQITNYPALQALGVHFTFYLITGKSSASNPIWAQAIKDGHELGNHTKNHYQTGTAADVDAATSFLQDKYGVRAWTMAAPYGDASYIALAQSRFSINRGVSNAIIAPNGSSNPFNLPCFIPDTGALAADFRAQIDSAQAAGGWRVVLVHGFSGGTDGAYQPVDITEFTSSVEHTKSLGNMWIDSMVNVGSYWLGQKAVSAATLSTTDGDKTWAWTLPPNFPPGKCLRVTVPGGTVKQAGNVIPWDDHGYYEIFLDAGSLTLSP